MQIEYEDPMNATYYEEYEIDEDNFDSARRERPETWKREVYHQVNWACVKWCLEKPINIHLFLLLRWAPGGRKARKESQLWLNRWAAKAEMSSI